MCLFVLISSHSKSFPSGSFSRLEDAAFEITTSMTKLTYILLLLTLLSCTSSKKENEEVKNDSIQSTSSSPVDSGDMKLQIRRRELEKIGYNYSRKISSTKKITYKNKELTYVLDLQDSSNHIQGEVYVELVNDSSFIRLYIFNGKDLKYFVGDYIFTNKIDTTEYGNPHNSLWQFDLRWKHTITIFCGGSDPLTINYYDKAKRFDWFRTP